MNVFFIGIIRNSYLTWLSLPHLFCLVYALAFFLKDKWARLLTAFLR